MEGRRIMNEWLEPDLCTHWNIN